MKSNYFLYIPFLLFVTSCQSQSTTEINQVHVGGNCEGCEALYEYKNADLNSMDTLPGFQENEPKLIIEGTVFMQDKKTPAENVIIYIYHTNREGIYEIYGEEKGWGLRHGSIRGWIKTGKNGKYMFYTFRPGAYPGRTVPEHIHVTVKEPDKNEYYIDEIVFTDDPLLTDKEKMQFPNRGGSGIVTPTINRETLRVQRDIFLGLNIPNYE